MSENRNDDEFEQRLDNVAESLRDVADQISALRHHLPRNRSPGSAYPGPDTLAETEPRTAPTDAAESAPPARGTPAYRPNPARVTDEEALWTNQPDPSEAEVEGSADGAPEATVPPPEAQSAATTGTSAQVEPSVSPEESVGDESASDAGGFRVENWIDKIGIALVLLGVGILYKLSVEMGLITPPMKVLLGGIVSTSLLGVGLKIRSKRRNLAQILMGGASAGFYLTVFAASQIYELISDPVALVATLCVAGVTFGLALREDTPALTVVGAIGAFATPFFLEAANAGQLLAFNAIIVAGMTAVYVYKGWTALLLTYAIGGWLVVVYAAGLQLDDAFAPAVEATLWADMLAQIGLTVVWLATGVVPAVRAWLVTRDGREGEFERGSFDTLMVFGMALLGPILYQISAHILWEWSDTVWAAFDITWAIGAGFLAYKLQGEESELFAAAFRFVALMFGTLALFEFFDGQWLPTALAIEAVAVCYMGRRLDDDLFRALGHLMLVGTSIALLVSLEFASHTSPAFFNAEFLRAAIMISALAAVSVDEDVSWFVLGYRYAAHGLFLLVVLDQAMALEHGHLVCTAIWGAYAIGVLVAGTVVDSRQTTIVGFLSIILTAAKLIVFDMADTETIWRVAVFIGFGGALLLTSYVVPGLAGGRRSDPTQPPGGDVEREQRASA